ncbi:hypothetical protein KIN20_020520, partial [Parelaphostrongylus tenuis]
MSDDKVNMALDDIIKLNKKKRAGKAVKRNAESVRQVRGRRGITSRARGGIARRRAASLSIGQRRGARSRFIQRRGVTAPSVNASALNSAATRRLVKRLVNKALRRMRATSTSRVADRGAVYADAAITGVSARSQAIRKRVVEVPRIVVRRRRPVRPIRRQQAEEEPERVVYQPVRVVQRELSPVQVVRQRQIRPVYRNERAAAVRGLQNGQRAAVIPVRQFIQQRSRQFPIRQNRVFSQQSAALKNGVLVERNFYGNRRQNPRASVIYVNEEMSSR